jgi:subtilisin family serine protease
VSDHEPVPPADPTLPAPGPPPTAPGWAAPQPSNVGAIVAAVILGVVAVPVALGGAGAGWVIDQLGLVTGIRSPGWAWPLLAVVTGLLIGGPAALLATIPRSAAVRVTGRVWLLASIAATVLGLLRVIPAVHQEAYLGLVAVLAAGGAWVLRLRRRPGTTHGKLLAVAAGLAVALPWLAIGALGGLLETLLAAAAAAAVGWLASGILDGDFWAAYAGSPARLVPLGGSVAGVALTVLAAGVGHSGVHLAELLVLPPLGYLLAALYAASVRTQEDADAPVEVEGPDPADNGWQAPRPEAPTTAPSPITVGKAPVGWLVGIAAAGPLAFVDPQEVTLLLATTRDVPTWTALAAGISWVAALFVGGVYAMEFARRRSSAPRRWTGAVAAAVLSVAAVGVYVGPGQPGLYGDRLFVILKAQADLSGITGTGMAGRDARAAEVYRRLVATAAVSQADLRQQLDRWHLAYTPYYLVNGLEVDAGEGVRAWLAGRDDVDRVLVTERLRPLPAPGGVTRGSTSVPPTAADEWNISQIGADRVRSELKVDGRQIVVGSSDSGVDGTHPALAGGFRGGDDSWWDPWNGTTTPTDHGGHGTHTLGSAVGGLGIGVAPGAQWVGCVNLDRNLGNPAHYLDCLQFMLAPFPAGGDPFTAGRPARGPQVLTNSWGCPTIEGCDAGALRSATAAFAAAGTFFVVAAGNSGPDCDTVDDPPATYPDVLSVGAVDRSGKVAGFSSRGPAPDGSAKPDLVAPGAGVWSALPGGTYGELDGTSMAAPHVAGVVALMWSAQPALVGDLERTRQLLRDTAAPTPVPGDGCGGPADVTGAGRVDAYAAVRAALAIR